MAATPVPISISHAQADVTERVRVHARRRASSDTNLVGTPRKRSRLVWIAGVILIGGGLAAVIALRGSGPSAADAEDTAPTTVKMALPPPDEPPPIEPPPVEMKPVEPTAETKPVEPPPVETKPVAVSEDSKVEPKKPRLAAKPPVKIVKKPVARPVANPPPPKESKSWNTDSPFMPVRTH